MTTTEIQALVDDCRSHDHIQHWHALHLLDAIEALLARDNIRTFAEQEVKIAELEEELSNYRRAADVGHPTPCNLGPLCPYCHIEHITAELARVKAESLRVVVAEDNGNLHDWYMTPTGLGYPGKDRKQNNCIESAEGYYRIDECKPVRLERWEAEG